MTQYRDFTGQLNNSYEDFREGSLTNRRFKHSDIKPLIEKLKHNPLFSVKELGISAQGRDIFLLTLGSGKTKVFLWSQMHGDESTATMALFDIFNFFVKAGQFDDIKKEMLKKLTICFIPMVNPDGAEVFERRNSYQVDLNRDAARLQAPESRILKETFNSLRADFGFNLHDQSIYYSTGKSFKSAAVSLLAPPADFDKNMGPVREKAVKLVCQLYSILSDFIPGHISKYTDEYEPRAFGDNFQAWGTSTILIETGGWKGDPEKQFLRKLNFIILLSAFKSIADKGYLNESTDTYDKIPLNEEDYMMDLILRNVNYKVGDQNITIDVGINRTEVNTDSAKSFYSLGRVADMGDLSVYNGYDDYDLAGMEISPGRTYDKRIASYEELSKLNFSELFSHRFTNVIADFEPDKEYSEFPVNLLLSQEKPAEKITVEGPANFCISRNGKVKYVIVNGFFIEPGNPLSERINGEIIR